MVARHGKVSQGEGTEGGGATHPLSVREGGGFGGISPGNFY